MERTRFVTDRRTDRRMGKNNMSPDPVGGRHNKRGPKIDPWGTPHDIFF